MQPTNGLDGVTTRFLTGSVPPGQTHTFELSPPFATQDPAESVVASAIVLDVDFSGCFDILDVLVADTSILLGPRRGGKPHERDLLPAGFRRSRPDRKLKVILQNLSDASASARGTFTCVPVAKEASEPAAGEPDRHPLEDLLDVLLVSVQSFPARPPREVVGTGLRDLAGRCRGWFEDGVARGVEDVLARAAGEDSAERPAPRGIFVRLARTVVEVAHVVLAAHEIYRESRGDGSKAGCHQRVDQVPHQA
jgi:hypothetical protein